MMKLETILSGSDVVHELLAPKKLQSQTDHLKREFHTDVGMDGQTAVETGVLIYKGLCVEQTLSVP